MTFRIKPLEAIEFNYLPRPIKDLTEREVDAIIDASSGLICWTVGRKAHFQTRKRIDRVGPFGSLFAAGRRKLWNHTEARVGRFIDRRIPTRSLRNGAHNAWFAGSKLLLSTLRLTGGATLYNPDKTIDYSGTKPSAKYAFTFWAFPRAQWLGALRDYLVFSEQHFKKYDFRCNMALGSYFIRKDASSLLSYTHDGDIFSIDPIHAYTDKPAWDRFLKEFNEFAYKRNGIPLLNQSPFVERRHVEAAYGARWQEFSSVGQAARPGRSHAEPFFRSPACPEWRPRAGPAIGRRGELPKGKGSACDPVEASLRWPRPDSDGYRRSPKVRRLSLSGCRREKSQERVLNS